MAPLLTWLGPSVCTPILAKSLTTTTKKIPVFSIAKGKEKEMGPIKLLGANPLNDGCHHKIAKARWC